MNDPLLPPAAFAHASPRSEAETGGEPVSKTTGSAGSPPDATITGLLQRWSAGERGAVEYLIERVYGELRRIARIYFRRERPDHTLQATALVHEVVLDLLEQSGIHWRNRSHFFGLAACMMRRALVQHAREKTALKRGGRTQRVPLDETHTGPPRPDHLLALDEALQTLERLDARKAQIVELRFFGGLSVEQAARCLSSSPRTVAREWRRARAFLYRELSSEERHGL